MGLQVDVELKQVVQGYCYSEYDWFSESLSTSQYDAYPFWNHTYKVLLESEEDIPPRVESVLPFDYDEQILQRNVTFAFIVHSAGPRSYTRQNDV
jgi:hypothetical protein